MKTKGKDPKARANVVTAQVRDMDFSPLEGADKNSGCRFTSDHVIVAIYHKKTADGKERLIVATVDEDHKETECYAQDMPDDFFSKDHETFLFIAAQSGTNRLSNRHEINRISFKDIEHLHDDEELLDPEDQRSWVGKGQDLMAIKQHEQFGEHTISSYNNEQMKHNKLYAQLVGEFIANSERIVKNLHSLPR